MDEIESSASLDYDSKLETPNQVRSFIVTAQFEVDSIDPFNAGVMASSGRVIPFSFSVIEKARSNSLDE